MSLRFVTAPHVVAGILCCAAAPEVIGQPESKRSYNLPRGDAATTLSQFAGVSGRQIVFMMDKVRGERTNAVVGEFAPGEALQRMLAGTALVALQDQMTGAFVIRRNPPPPHSPKPTEDAPKPMKRKNPLAVVATWLALSLAPSPVIKAADGSPAGAVEGRVLNSRNGENLERARLTVEGTSIEVFTDASGQYRLSPVPAGMAKVKVFFTGLEPLTATITIAAGQSVQRDFDLGAARAGADRDNVVRLGEFVVGASREMDGAAIAINEQRFAPNISHVVSAGEFGVSADGSVGEFLKFLPGISVDYVGGTANTISMDGVPSNYVPVTVGGFDLASTSSASTSRSTELLQISIHNAARLEVSHSPTSESPAAALAGSINIVPRSAFERSRPLLTGSVYLMMRDNYRTLGKTEGPRKYDTRKIQPGFDFSYIVPVNNRFGFTVSGSFSRQFIPQDTVTNTWRGASGATTGLVAAVTATQYPDTTPDKPYLSDFQVSDAVKFNDRSSFGTTLDYKLGPYDTLTLSYQYGSFGSENNNNTIAFATNRIEPGNFSLTSVRGATGRGQLTLTNGARWRDGETHMPNLVYRHLGPVWRTEAGAGYSHSTNHNRDTSRGYLGALTARRTNVTVAFDDIFYLRPGLVTVTDGTTGASVDPYNLGNYSLVSGGSPQPRDSIDIKRSAYANARRAFEINGVPLAFKVGLDVRESVRDMRGSDATYNYVGPANTAVQLLDESMSQRVMPYGLPKLQAMSADKGWDFYNANRSFFTSDPNAEYRSAVGFSKLAQEVVSSVYVRGDAAFFHGRLKLVGGVRAEQTNLKAEGPLSDPTRNFQRDASGRVILVSGVPARITTNALAASQLTYLDRGMKADKEYLRIFPNLNASFNVLDNLIARAAFYTSIGRPDYNQYAGGITLPEVDNPAATNQRITVNNVAIKPWMAQTIKARLEYYFEGVGQIAVGGFRREFENFFASTTFPATPEFLALYSLDPDIYGNYDVATQRNLAGKVKMTGFEFEYKQVLRFLPHWARGVQVFANLTSLRTTGEAAADFRGYVPRTYNWGVSLSRPKFSVRANWNYQGRRRLEAITGRSIEAGTYNWRLKRLNLDLQGEYNFWKRYSAFANFRNIGAATEDFERAGPSTPASAQFRSREDYGASWTFGVKGSF